MCGKHCKDEVGLFEKTVFLHLADKDDDVERCPGHQKCQRHNNDYTNNLKNKTHGLYCLCIAHFFHGLAKEHINYSKDSRYSKLDLDIFSTATFLQSARTSKPGAFGTAVWFYPVQNLLLKVKNKFVIQKSSNKMIKKMNIALQ